MNKLKRVLATAGTSSVLAVSMAGVAAADAVSTNNCSSNDGSGVTCSARATDNSTNYTVNGNCSGIIQTEINQNQENSNVQMNMGSETGAGDNNNSNSNSTAQSQAANVTFSPDCSTHTTVASASTGGHGAAEAQVDVPKGAVHAGGGAASTSSTSFASLLGLTGSVATLGAGVVMSKKGLLGL